MCFSWPFCHVHSRRTRVQGPYDVEVHVQMLDTCPIFRQRRGNWPVPVPPVPRFFPKSPNLLRIAENLEHLPVLLYPVDRSVELNGLAVSAEDFAIEEVPDAALNMRLRSVQSEIHIGWSQLRTVASMPTSITTKLTDCCVVRAAFSRAERSDQSMRPSSLTVVTFFRPLEDPPRV